MDPDLRAALKLFAATEASEGKALDLTARDCVACSVEGELDDNDEIDSDQCHWKRESALLPSTRGDWWLLPIGDKISSLAGSSIYMPYSWRARLLKKLLLTAIRFPSTTWVRHKAVIGSTKPMLLQQLVTQLTEESKPVFSLRIGTPSLSQANHSSYGSGR